MQFTSQNIVDVGFSTGVVPVNAWTHIAVTYDVSGNYNFYINGVLAGTGTNLITFTSAPYSLGVFFNQGGSSTFFFNGSLDDVRVYNRALSAGEVKRLYNMGQGMKFGTPPSNPSPCDSSVWYCDSDKLLPNTLGDGSKIVVAKVDTGTPLNTQWKTSQAACVTPQCQQNGPVNGNNLVSDNSVDFSAYPARDACKSIGGRLPTKTELQSINTSRALFGSFYTSYYWSATEYDTNNAWLVFLNVGVSTELAKDSYENVRCVKGYTPPANSLDKGLVGYWTFDNNKIYGSSALDSSGNNNTGTISGATPTIGKLGQALKFDGTGSVSISSISGGTANSACLWIKPADLSNSPVLLGSSYNVYFFALASNGIVYYSPEAGIYVNSSATIGTGVWTYLCVTRNGTSVKFYADGSQLGTDQTLAANSSGPNTTSIGFNDVNKYVGSMDDVRIYNRALSADEVKRLYNIGAGTHVNTTPTNSLTTGLVGYWTFDNNKIYGTSALDSSGNNNTGTITGATPVAGKLGQALKFDGSSNITLPNLSFGTGSFSVGAWIKTKNSAGAIVANTNNGGCAGYYLEINSNKLQMSNCESGTKYRFKTGNTVLKTGTWYHVVGTWDPNDDIHLYVNGKEETTSAGGSVQLINSSSYSWNNAFVGYLMGVEYFTGSIDDVRIYNRALSADEIKRLYNMGK